MADEPGRRDHPRTCANCSHSASFHSNTVGAKCKALGCKCEALVLSEQHSEDAATR